MFTLPFSWKLYEFRRWGSLFTGFNLYQKIMRRQDLLARVCAFIFQESLQGDDLYKYTCNSNDYFVTAKTVWLTWGLEHLTWTGCRSTWRHTTKECLASAELCSLWDVTASVEVQPIGSNRLRLCCCPNNVYMLNWLRLIVHGKASPGVRHKEKANDIWKQVRILQMAKRCKDDRHYVTWGQRDKHSLWSQEKYVILCYPI